MAFPLYSQIPRVVLEKLNPKKKVKFTGQESDSENNDDEDARKVTSSWIGIDSNLIGIPELDTVESLPLQLKPKSALKKIDNWPPKIETSITKPQINNENKIIKNPVEVADAIVQTNPKPTTREVSTQTHDTYPPMMDSYNLFKTQLEANALSKFNPMYSFPKKDGKPPPLKIGLTLRGKKRKVFYPDDEYKKQDIAPGS